MKYLIIMLLLFASCSSNRHITGEYVGDNPVEYVFDVPESQMCKIIESSYHFSQNNKSYDFRNYFVSNTKKWREYKYKLMPLLGAPGSYEYISKVYFDQKGNGYPYHLIYYIYLDSVDISKTKVRIEANDPEVEIGLTLLPVPPHFVRMYTSKLVSPTSVEEYELLLILGREIGVEKEMPKLKIPPKIIIKSLKKHPARRSF